MWDSTEAFYGLGQHQAGVWNYHGEDVEISQDNTKISVPMFSPATATEFSGTIHREADSITVSRTRSI